MRDVRTSLRCSSRAGFTLVEMLVVIIIVMVLATLTVTLTPRIAGEQKMAKAADQVQGYLAIAKSRAKRDQIPTGVRLLLDSAKNVRELHYIQQPDDFVGGKIYVTGDRVFVFGSTIDFTGGFTVSGAWPVQVGDYIEIKGGGPVHRIRDIPPAGQPLILASAHPYNIDPTAATEDYRIIRQPRVLIGETPMLLAQDIVIDTKTNATYFNQLPPENPNDPLKTDDNTIDLMFAPSGALLNSQGTNSFVALWVRDVTADSPLLGNPVLIVIMKRTGFIASHPVDVSGPSPYTFANDGKSSGL